MTSLVIGALSNLPAQMAEPFARTLRACGYGGTICFVVGRMDGDRAKLSRLADVVVEVDHEYPDELRRTRATLAVVRRTRRVRRLYPRAFEALARSTSDRWRELEFHLEGLQSLRFAHYDRYVREHDADKVLLTDVRDVVFQRDPFTEPVDGLELYLEDPSVRFGLDQFNTRWLREVYGRAELERLRGRPVSCSGTVIGTRSAVLDYLGAMSAEVARHRRPMGSRDQAVHNMLLARGRFPAAHVIANGKGRVLTMGQMSEYRTGPSGAVENVDGTIPAVLHQWDRHAELVERFRGRE